MGISDILSRAREALFGTATFRHDFPEKKQEIISKAREQMPTPTPTLTPTPSIEFPGLVVKSPSADIASLISNSATKYNLHPSLLAAILYQESRFNPEQKGPGEDWGIAQINIKKNPDVSKKQALDPNFAIPWMTRYLAESLEQFGEVNRALASYNVGRGGANVKGKMPFGGGPLGQRYIDNVARNLDVETRKSLGLKTTY